jgi:hypothetical protein
LSSLALAELRERVLRANQELVRAGLVTLSFGNASGVDRATGVLVPKSGRIPSYLAEKHCRRKHGPNVCYGQKTR